MKKTLHLLLAGFITISVMGQAANMKIVGNSDKKFQGIQNNLLLQNKTNTSKINQLKSATIEKQRLDSIVTEGWDENLSQWEISDKDVYKYDANGLNTLLFRYEWDETTGQLETYDKEEFSYYENGTPETAANYYWNASTSAWIGTSKNKYTFNASGKLTKSLSFDWDQIGNEWDTTYKIQLIYDTILNMTYYNGFELNENTNTWDTANKTINTYDTVGNITKNISYSWETDQWITSYLMETYYDEMGNDTMQMSSWWHPIDSMLHYSSKVLSSYDDKGNQVLSVEYDWDINDSLWISYNKTESTYDAIGNQILCSEYSWNETDSIWVPENIDQNTYDYSYSYNDIFWPYYYYGITEIFSGNIPTQTYSYRYNDTDWIKNEKTTYFYSIHGVSSLPNIISENEIKVFPNPAKDYVTFNLEGSFSDLNLEIFDVQGRKVIDQIIENNTPVSVQNLSNGLYMFKLTHNGSVSTGKMVVKQ